MWCLIDNGAWWSEELEKQAMLQKLQEQNPGIDLNALIANAVNQQQSGEQSSTDNSSSASTSAPEEAS